MAKKTPEQVALEREQKRKAKIDDRILQKKREKVHSEMIESDYENRKKEKVAPEGVCISLQHINKIYPNHVQAVFDFNLDIKDKEFIVFVGPSGCGKSTTLRMIAGLEDITFGDLYIGGRFANDLLPKERDVAMVFQSYALYPNMTVYDNLAFSLKVRHLPKDEIQERVMNAAKILEIEEYLDRKPAALSGGQRQRVALGRAIVRNAKVFLMDEPLSNLDAKLRVQMRSELVKLHNRIGSTTVYVTHDQTEAMTMASRIVVMKLGYIQQIGTPKEIYNNPANVFVATFIGSPAMNIIKATYEKGTVTLPNGFALKLKESEVESDEKFYRDAVSSLKAEIELHESEILARSEDLRNAAQYKLKQKIAKANVRYNSKIDDCEAMYRLLLSDSNGNPDEKTKAKIDKLNQKAEALKAEKETVLQSFNDKLAFAIESAKQKEEARKADLRNLCSTKGLSYDKEESDYQARVKAEQDALIDKDDLIVIARMEKSEAEGKLAQYMEVLSGSKHDVLFGVRPEDILQKDSASIIKNASEPFEIKVSIAELLGNEYYVHTDAFGQDAVAKVSSNHEIDSGETITVSLNLEHVHLFDPISTNRIF